MKLDNMEPLFPLHFSKILLTNFRIYSLYSFYDDDDVELFRCSFNDPNDHLCDHIVSSSLDCFRKKKFREQKSETFYSRGHF